MEKIIKEVPIQHTHKHTSKKHVGIGKNMKGFYKNNFEMMKKEVEEDSREWKGSCKNDCIMKSNEQIHAIPIKSKCPSLQK